LRGSGGREAATLDPSVEFCNAKLQKQNCAAVLRPFALEPAAPQGVDVIPVIDILAAHYTDCAINGDADCE
jgi:hypothetical protein